MLTSFSKTPCLKLMSAYIPLFHVFGEASQKSHWWCDGTMCKTHGNSRLRDVLFLRAQHTYISYRQSITRLKLGVKNVVTLYSISKTSNIIWNLKYHCFLMDPHFIYQLTLYKTIEHTALYIISIICNTPQVWRSLHIALSIPNIKHLLVRTKLISVALVHKQTIPTKWSIVPTSVDRWHCMVSATDPHGHILNF
jgi:hypothetical protein